MTVGGARSVHQSFGRLVLENAGGGGGELQYAAPSEEYFSCVRTLRFPELCVPPSELYGVPAGISRTAGRPGSRCAGDQPSIAGEQCLRRLDAPGERAAPRSEEHT